MIRRLFPRLLLALGILSVNSGNTNAGENADGVTRSPYWTTKHGFDSVLLINNPTPADLSLQLRVLAKSGQVLYDGSLELENSQSLQLSLSNLVGRQKDGQLELRYPAAVQMLPAQVLISNRFDALTVDFRDDLDREFNRRNRYGIIPSMVRHSLHRASVVLANSGEADFDGTLNLDDGLREDVVHWRVKAGRVEIIQLPPGQMQDSDSTALSLRPSGPGLGLMAFAFLELHNGELLAVPLQGGSAPSAAGMAGFFGQNRSTLLVRNLEERKIDLQIQVFEENGNSNQATIEIGPADVREVDLKRLIGSPMVGQGAVTVRVMGRDQGRLAGSILDEEPEFRLTALKDLRAETNPGYSFPLRLGADFTSKVRVFNPNEEPLDMCVFLYFGEERYTYPIKTLGAQEMVEVDVREAQQSGLPDEFGEVIPKTADHGQLKIITHSPELENLLVLGSFDERDSELEAPFQGCFICPPEAFGASLEPASGVADFVGDSSGYDVFAQFNDGTSKEVTLSPDTSVGSLDPFIAQPQFGTVDFVGLGSTSMLAVYNGCTHYTTELGGEGARNQCECTSRFPFDTLPISADGYGVFITGPSFINVGEPSTTISRIQHPTGDPITMQALSNASSDPACVDISSNNAIRAFAPGQVQLQASMTVDGETGMSNVFTVELRAQPQVVHIVWQTRALDLLRQVFFDTEVTAIQNRVELVLETRYAGSNVLFQNNMPPGVTMFSTISIDSTVSGGSDIGGRAPFDLLNKERRETAFVGLGPLDLLNDSDPVLGGDNERRDTNRVGDAIGRIAVHELAHTLGLTARNTELNANPLAFKLGVNNIGLGGSSTHHSGSNDWDEIMNSAIRLSEAATWSLTLYDFTQPERFYLSRILP